MRRDGPSRSGCWVPHIYYKVKLKQKPNNKSNKLTTKRGAHAQNTKIISHKCRWRNNLPKYDNFSFAKIIHPPDRWHIKKLIKPHDHYTGAPSAGDNKRPLWNVQFGHTTDVSSFADCKIVQIKSNCIGHIHIISRCWCSKMLVLLAPRVQ